jgi:hypothetical protein
MSSEISVGIADFGGETAKAGRSAKVEPRLKMVPPQEGFYRCMSLL